MDWNEKDIGDWVMRYRQWNESQHDFVIVSIFFSQFLKVPLSVACGSKWKTIKNRLTIISQGACDTIPMNFDEWIFFTFILSIFFLTSTTIFLIKVIRIKLMNKMKEARKKLPIIAFLSIYIAIDGC